MVKKWGYLVGAAFFATSFASQASAQEADSDQQSQTGVDRDAAADSGNMIIVTARKVAETVQDVPLAITAFSERDLRERSITSLQDIALQTPGFNYEDYSNGGYGVPTIRGATNFNITSLEQNVSVFVDGIYVPRQYSFDVGTLSLRRVEIVKGPQSALYGANAFAGAINYITTDRDLSRFEGHAEIGASENKGFDLSAKVNVPVVPGSIAVRAAASLSRFGGDIPNNHPNANVGIKGGTNGKFAGYNNNTMRVGMSAKPFDALTIDFDYYRFQVRDEVSAGYRIESSNGDMNCGSGPRLFCGTLSTTPIPGPSKTPGYVQDPRSTGIDSNTYLYRVAAQLDLTDELSVNYLYGKIYGNVFAGGNSDKDPLLGNAAFGGRNVFSYGPTGNYNYESHEARLQYEGASGIYAMVGGFKQNGRDYDLFAAGTSPLRGTNPLTGVEGLIIGVPATTDTKLQAVFGRIQIPLMADKLTVSAEGRYTDEKKAVADATRRFNYAETYFTPRFQIDYKFSPDNMVYASVAKGVKSGGVNTSSFAALIADERFYGPDTNWTYEIGSKNSFAGGRGYINAAAFLIDWTALQVPQTPTGAPFNTATITVNLGGAKSKGVELAAEYEIVENLRLSGTLAYIDATYNDGVISGRVRRAGTCDDVICAKNGDVSGNTLQRQSPWQWSAGAAYRAPITDTLEAFARIDVFGQSRQFTDETNLTRIAARTLANVRFGVEGERWSLAAWAKNLLNKTYVSNAFATATPFASNYVPSIGAKRRIGVTATYDF